MMEDFIKNWHTAFESKDASLLSDLLADEVTFYSPVVYSPQEGKMITFFYLQAASQVLANDKFVYVNEVVNDRYAILEFETELDGIYVNGVDMIQINDEGKIIEFKVMVRPLQAMNKLHTMMGEMMQQMKGK